MKGFGTVRRKQSIDRKTAQFLVQVKAKKAAQERVAKVQVKPWENLERRLGVPFRKNLLAALNEIVEQNHHPSAIASWIARVSCGVSKAVTGNPENTYLYVTLRTHLIGIISQAPNKPAVIQPRIVATKANRQIHSPQNIGT
jgi:hypothetical protein